MKRLALAALLAAAPACWIGEGGRVHDVWAISRPAPREAACFRIDPWVSQSARDGVGVSVRLEGRGEAPCDVEIRSARLVVGSASAEAKSLPPPMRLTRRNAVTFHLKLLFDDQRAWKQGEREAVLLVEARAGGHPVPPLRWSLARVPWEASR